MSFVEVLILINFFENYGVRWFKVRDKIWLNFYFGFLNLFFMVDDTLRKTILV